VALLGFAAAAAAWWLYFGRLEGAAIRPGLAPSFLYGYGHLPLFAGLAAFAVGVHLAVEHAADPALSSGARAALGGGTALYLAAVTFTQQVTVRSLRGDVLAARLVAVAAAAAFGIAGAAVEPAVLVGALAALLINLILFEAARARRREPAANAPDPPNQGRVVRTGDGAEEASVS
jgi:low temperature requirement protein LtrA